MKNIQFFFEEIEVINIPEYSIRFQINELIRCEGKLTGDICIIFCSDYYLSDINKRYLKRDNYTDIIAFNYVNKNIIAGDLFISIKRVKDNAIIYKTTFYKELFRVVFHGILHLIGYNDTTEREKEIMKEKENFYLNSVDFFYLK